MTTKEIEIRINSKYASLAPPLDAQTYNALLESIRINGQREAIKLNSNYEIIDGHHRFQICKDLKLIPKYAIESFDDPLLEEAYAIDVNVARRQLTIAQKVQLLLKKKPIMEALAKRHMSMGGKGALIDTPLGRIDDVLAKQANTSATTFRKIQTILNKAPEDAKNRVLLGRSRPNKIYRQIEQTEAREEARKRAAAEIASLTESEIGRNKLSQFEIINLDIRDPKLFDLIKDNSIDLIWTDPPYTEKSLPLYIDLAKFAERVLKPGCSLMTIVGHYALLRIGNMIEQNAPQLKYQWVFCIKHSGRSTWVHKGYLFAKWKPMLWFTKGNKWNKPLKGGIDLIDSEQPPKLMHKWEQSTIEAGQIIDWLTVGNNQIICDPFCGSGTTGVAAMKLNRKFIGIEKDSADAEIARSKILNF